MRRNPLFELPVPPILKANRFGVFELHEPTEESARELKGMGFRKDKTTRLLSTRSPVVAYKALQYAEPRTRTALERLNETHAASRALHGASCLKSPPGALSYFPYQVAGVEFLRDHKKCLLADEPGSGKSRMTIGLVNECPEIRKVLILCPASLRLNWHQELAKWLIEPLTVLEVVSYDSAWRAGHFQRLIDQPFDLVVMDEAHYIKNDESKRSMAAQALAKSAPRVVLLTGTPVENVPSDLFPLLHTLVPKMFPDFMPFAIRYCGAFLQEIKVRGREKKVWNTNGASNEQELQDILRSTVMIRRLKRDVLPQLPKKVRQIIEIENSEASVGQEQETWKLVCHEIGYDEALAQLESGIGPAFTEMAGVRQEVALSKIPYVVEHVENLLRAIDKVVVFAYHKAVVAALMEGLAAYNPVQHVGGMTDRAKDEAVKTFQTDETCRVFVGNIKSAGVGITLTASSTVVFAELLSVPSQMSQAEDRCCRIGTTADSVLVQHIVLNGSLDVHFARKLVTKQEVSDLILDL